MPVVFVGAGGTLICAIYLVERDPSYGASLQYAHYAYLRFALLSAPCSLFPLASSRYGVGSALLLRSQTRRIITADPAFVRAEARCDSSRGHDGLCPLDG